MRFACLVSLLALSTAAVAAEPPRTERIPLRYASAVEIARQLETPAARGSERNLIHKDLQAWSVDERENALLASGTSESIDELKKIVRLLDIPRAQLKLTVRLLDPNQPNVARLLQQVEFMPQQGEPLAAGMLPAKELPALEALPTSLNAPLLTSNNRAVRLRAPWPVAGKQQPWSLHPRLNGDATVTLYVGPSTPEAGPLAADAYALRRVVSGDTLLIRPQGQRAVVAITVQRLPDPLPPVK